MINKKIIEEVKKRLVKTYNPIAIYLFRSYAWGKPTEDSDLDLLIVVDKSDEKSFNRVRSGHRVLFGLGISKDLIVFTKDEFDEKSNNITTLCHKIKEYGELC
ncbi:MAG: nucleotidyltransferase domain-containing protein [bacterium]